MGALLAARFESLGDTPGCIAPKTTPITSRSIFRGTPKIKPVLLLGHFDTVYPLGTLGEMLCRVDYGNALDGPGCVYMKSGIALMLYAIEALQAWYAGLRRPVTVFLVSDEGSRQLFVAANYDGVGQRIGCGAGA